jgi:hypothetical protein
MAAARRLRPERFALDFVARPPRSTGAARALAVAGLAALVLASARYLDASQSLATVQAERRATRPAAVQALSPRLSPAEAAALSARARAVNAHIRALNFPWGKVLKAVQPPRALEVSVVRLEMGQGERANLLRVEAEAKGAPEMIEYVAYLAEKRELRGAFLRQHERVRDDSAHPYRFDIEAAWSGTH